MTVVGQRRALWGSHAGRRYLSKKAVAITGVNTHLVYYESLNMYLCKRRLKEQMFSVTIDLGISPTTDDL
jgi:hypothetical protein